jgi:hypothetical protein
VTLWTAWPAARCSTKWSEEETDAIWADLGSEDAKKAFRAARRLAEAPAQAAALIRTRIHHAAAPEVKTVSRLGWLTERFDDALAACGLREKEETPPSPAQLRAIRTAEALEHCSSAEARQVLKASRPARQPSDRR